MRDNPSIIGIPDQVNPGKVPFVVKLVQVLKE
jgi:hypothetical protein